MKDYTTWQKEKTLLNNEKQRPFFHEKEVWFCHLGENIGFEQDGKGDEFIRPVVIIKKFNNECFWGIPLTKTKKIGKYYFEIDLSYNKSTLILSQLRLCDSKRLKYKIGSISEGGYQNIREKLKQLLT